MSVNVYDKNTGELTPISGGGGDFNPDELTASATTPTDSEILITKESGGWVKKTVGKIWDYTKNKIGISSSGSASKYLNEQGTFTTIPEIDEDTTPTTISYTPTIAVDNALGVNAEDIKVKIDAVQDLHGYDKPWVGGAGKNKLILDLATIKALNTTGSWNGNVYSEANGTITVITDSNNNIIGIRLNGTFNANIHFCFITQGIALNADTYIFGCAYNSNNALGTTNTYYGYLANVNGVANWKNSYHDLQAGRTFTITNTSAKISAGIYINSGSQASNVTIYPMIRLASITDDTFAPYSNICPITGWDEINVTRSGKNLLNPQGNDKGVKTQYGVTFTPLADGSFLVNSNGAATGQARYYFASDMVFKENVIFSVEGAQSGKVQAWCNNKHANNPLTIDANDTLDTTFLFVNTGDTVTNVIVKPMIRLASDTDGTYEPYQGNIYTIDLNDTRYGGTLDVTSGELTLTHGYVDLGDLNWSKYGTSTAYDRYISNGIDAYAKEGSDGVCSHYPVLHTWQANALIIGNGGSRLSIFTTYGEYADATAFKASLSGAQLVYELATPQIIQLTPTQIKMLQGNNSLFADSGDTQLEYFGKTIGGIEGAIDGISEDVEELRKMKVAITALGDDESGRTIASRAYVTGEYFYQDGKMYKVLTSIASGATFTVGTNCSQTTIFAELKALAQ